MQMCFRIYLMSEFSRLYPIAILFATSWECIHYKRQMPQSYGSRPEKIWLCSMRTIKAQTSLRIRAVWSAPLLFIFSKEVWHHLIQAKFSIIVSIFSWADSFERFTFLKPLRPVSRIEAQFNIAHQHFKFEIPAYVEVNVEVIPGMLSSELLLTCYQKLCSGGLKELSK